MHECKVISQTTSPTSLDTSPRVLTNLFVSKKNTLRQMSILRQNTINHKMSANTHDNSSSHQCSHEVSRFSGVSHIHQVSRFSEVLCFHKVSRLSEASRLIPWMAKQLLKERRSINILRTYQFSQHLDPTTLLVFPKL